MSDLFGRPAGPVEHPGWACCDPTQDLAGWIVRQRARVDLWGRWVRVLHQRGDRLRRAGTGAYLGGNVTFGQALDLASIGAHGRANAIAQRALIVAGHVDRVEEAHRGRLQDGQPGEEGEAS